MRDKNTRKKQDCLEGKTKKREDEDDGRYSTKVSESRLPIILSASR